MKYFILLHNLIMMAQASIMNSVERWTADEIDRVVTRLIVDVEAYHRNGYITDYQMNKLITMAENIEPPTT